MKLTFVILKMIDLFCKIFFNFFGCMPTHIERVPKNFYAEILKKNIELKNKTNGFERFYSISHNQTL
jgi:hypothetical protein